MLSKNDKKWILDVVQAAVKEAVEEALTAEIEWEQKRHPQTGVLYAKPKLVNEKIFLPAFFAQHLKFHEGAYRGNQETLDKAKNKLGSLGGKVDKLGDAFLAIENPMVVLERFVGLLARTGIMDRLEDIATIDITGPEQKKIASGG